MTWAAIVEGLAFVRRNPVVLGCMTLDMFAVILGGATALLPVYAQDILQVGAGGYGLLSGSLEIGALVMSALLLFLPSLRRAGVLLLAAVAVYGLATIGFGLSRSFPLSVACYMLVGMADAVSVVLRQTAVQLSTPDELRGRVSAVNFVFIGASNNLGAAESGFLAELTSATFSVVFGGVGCLVVVAFVAWRLPALRAYRSTDCTWKAYPQGDATRRGPRVRRGSASVAQRRDRRRAAARLHRRASPRGAASAPAADLAGCSASSPSSPTIPRSSSTTTCATRACRDPATSAR